MATQDLPPPPALSIRLKIAESSQSLDEKRHPERLAAPKVLGFCIELRDDTFDAPKDRTGHCPASRFPYCLHFSSLMLSDSVRKLWIVLFCIGFSMWGSLVPAKHTLAHADAAIVDVADYDSEHAHHHDLDFAAAHLDHDSGDEHGSFDGHAGDHGAELHGIALCLEVASVSSPGPLTAEKFYFGDLSYPSAVIPPEPDPERA